MSVARSCHPPPLRSKRRSTCVTWLVESASGLLHCGTAPDYSLTPRARLNPHRAAHRSVASPSLVAPRGPSARATLSRIRPSAPSITSSSGPIWSPVPLSWVAALLFAVESTPPAPKRLSWVSVHLCLTSKKSTTSPSMAAPYHHSQHYPAVALQFLCASLIGRFLCMPPVLAASFHSFVSSPPHCSPSTSPSIASSWLVNHAPPIRVKPSSESTRSVLPNSSPRATFDSRALLFLPPLPSLARVRPPMPSHWIGGSGAPQVVLMALPPSRLRIGPLSSPTEWIV
jgi:hypothetical protein